MGSVLALVAIACALYFFVQAGTIAYQLTGMDKDSAQFQALSALTMTGFTTLASERVVRDPVRRRITTALIVVGYASTASIIAGLVTTVATETALGRAVNVVALALSLVVLASVLRNGTLNAPIEARIRKALATRLVHDQVHHEELLLYSQGYAITRVEVPGDSRLVGQSLREAALPAHNLQVLTLEREGEVTSLVGADTTLEAGDLLVLYGEVEQVQEAFGAPALSPDAPT